MFQNRKQVIIILCCSCIILLFNTFASTASLHFQLDYGSFFFVSFLIYIYTGFYCAKYGNLLTAIIGGGIVGLVESTIGWYISLQILYNPSEIDLDLEIIIVTIISVTLTAMFFGLIGGLMNRLLNR